ncbi:hypothetical protein CCR75_006770 [Bremia lactucae]|uniref:Uncharacterized protein n=1 Tax=Bremia lactucae TaxID=4779 RepID=A0A976FNC8_BRELC|nr:hypothetical protein CCR75_006770 [Bremia lactucae]
MMATRTAAATAAMETRIATLTSAAAMAIMIATRTAAATAAMRTRIATTTSAATSAAATRHLTKLLAFFSNSFVGIVVEGESRIIKTSEKGLKSTVSWVDPSEERSEADRPAAYSEPV